MGDRFFPFSQQFNSDPEGWELTERFGDRALRVWIQLLSIADRERGYIKGTIEEWAPILARQVYSKGNPKWIRRDAQIVTNCLEWMLEKHWLERVQRALREPSETPQRALRDASEGDQSAIRNGSEAFLKVVNYAKYHKTRSEHSPPPNLTKPNLTKHIYTGKPVSVSDDPNIMSVEDLADSWNEDFKGRLPVVHLPLSKSRQSKAQLRIKEHPDVEFWTTVFTNIPKSSFLMGSTGFICTFDWIIKNDNNVMKIWEGNYAEENKNTHRR